MSETTTEPTPTTQPYDRAAIFHDNGPFNPSFMREAIRTLFRTLPLDPAEPKSWSDRRMHAALLGLSALHPRDEIEVMLSVQALSAYHAAATCWRIGMNLGPLSGNNTRHITTACSAARTFDTMLRALERRQAKPLAIPIRRPAIRTWEDAPNPTEIITALEETCRADQDTTPSRHPYQPESAITWTPEQRAAVETLRREKENEGLDIANTEGILPGSGMILTEPPPSRPPTSAAASA